MVEWCPCSVCKKSLSPSPVPVLLSTSQPQSCTLCSWNTRAADLHSGGEWYSTIHYSTVQYVSKNGHVSKIEIHVYQRVNKCTIKFLFWLRESTNWGITSIVSEVPWWVWSIKRSWLQCKRDVSLIHKNHSPQVTLPETPAACIGNTSKHHLTILTDKIEK